MLFLLLFLLGCKEGPPNTWEGLMTSRHCVDAKNKNSCRAKECQNFYASNPTSTQADATRIKTFCDLMDQNDNQMAQVCGMPACLLLPSVSPEMALDILEKDLPRRTYQKMARKAIIRGFLQDPNGFEQVIEIGKNKEYWTGIAIAEVDCGENSAAKQFQIPCGGPYTRSAQQIWQQIENQSAEKSALLMHLATMLDPKPSIPKLIAIAIDPQQQPQKRITAGNALQIAVEKGYTLSPSGVEMIEESCKQPNDSALYSMCRVLEKISEK